MIKKKLYLLILAPAACLTGLMCSSTGNTAGETAGHEKYNVVAKIKYGEDAAYLFNPDRTFVVCYSQKKPTSLVPFPPLKYFIYDLKKASIIFEESLPNGRIKWLDNTKVEISLTPGIESLDEKENKRMAGYIYDVILRKKIYK